MTVVLSPRIFCFILFFHHGRLKLDFARPCCVNVLTFLLKSWKIFFKDLYYSSIKDRRGIFLFDVLLATPVCAHRPVAVRMRDLLDTGKKARTVRMRIGL